MRRWLLSVLSVLSVLSCTCACRTAEFTALPCEPQTLIQLSRSLDSSPEPQRAAAVWPGLVAACGEALGGPVLTFYDPPVERVPRHRALPTELGPEFEPLVSAVCPAYLDGGSQVMADAPADQLAFVAARLCGFQRFDVIDEQSLLGTTTSLMVSFYMHQWLLDQGLTPAQAKPITRALISREREVNSRMRGRLARVLPTAGGWPISDGFVVHVTRDEVAFDGRSVVRLRDGMFVDGQASVADGLVASREHILSIRGDVPELPLLIAAESESSFATILDLLHMGAQAGFVRFGIVVDSGHDELAWIPISPLADPQKTGAESGLYAMKGPSMDIPQMLPMPGMSIEISANELSLDGGNAPTVIGATELPALTEYALSTLAEGPRGRAVAISAEPTLELQTLVSFISAVRGPECRAQAEGCLFDEVLLLAEGAHALTNRGDDGPPRRPIETGPVRSTTRVVMAPPVVDGSLDPDIVRRIARAHINEIRNCYDAGPDQPGRLTVDYIIGANGEVESAAIASSDLPDPTVAGCIAKAIERWTYPKPADGKQVKVSHSIEVGMSHAGGQP